MKLSPSVACAAVLALRAAAPSVAAQCPSLAHAVVANACSSSGAALALLQESVQTSASLSQPCKVVFTLWTPPSCCSFTIARLLALGADPASIPLPGGCKLNVQPLVALAFPAPTTLPGVSVLELPLPATPSTIGLDMLAEAAIVRFDIAVSATRVDTTETHKLTFGP